MSEQSLKICHLYPEVLNLYGDRGNTLCLAQRLKWRGIKAEVVELHLGEKMSITDCDIFFVGGGQDFEQEVLLNDLKAGKGEMDSLSLAELKKQREEIRSQEKRAAWSEQAVLRFIDEILQTI